MKKILQRLCCMALALILALLPSLVSAESAVQEDDLQAQVSALIEQIGVLLAQDPTFTYAGETYPVSTALNYANEHLLGTEDYQPFCDALLEASVAHSNAIGELYLQEVKLLNAWAVQQGYDGYMNYACAMYGMAFDLEQVVAFLVDNYKALISLNARYAYLFTYVGDQNFLEHEDFLQLAADLYGSLSPEYKPMLEELIASDRLYLGTAPANQAYGETYYKGEETWVNVYSCDDLNFSSIVIHEFGHYLNHCLVYQDKYKLLPINETFSMGGNLLLADEMEAYYIQQQGETYGSLLTLHYLFNTIGFLGPNMFQMLLAQEVFAHPEDFQPEDLSRRFLEICLDLGYDLGYSPEYQMLQGAQWIQASLQFTSPFYEISYVLASINAAYLWYMQQNGEDGAALYNQLLRTPVPDVSYEEYCRQVGLPDMEDSALHQKLNDFLCDKLNTLLEKTGLV